MIDEMKLHLTHAIIKPYVDQGLVKATAHPTLPLTIYNYSRACQFEQSWDQVTLQCRGLILDSTDKIIARGFNKFFNYEDVEHNGEIPVHDEYVYVQEKMDGSLGILFHYADDWHMATRGSFGSDQAVAGLEILRKKYDLTKFHKTVCYLCEIVYPDNRIVVNYEEEKIMFLSAVMDGREVNWGTSRALFHSSGILEEDIVWTSMDVITENIFKRYKNLNEPNKEGFVLRFHPSNYRVKIKFVDYIRLHRLLTNFSNVDIWECLRNGDNLADYLENVPDEFDTWVRDWIRSIKFAFVMQEIDAKNWLAKLLATPDVNSKTDALWIQKNVPKDRQGLVFSMWKGKDSAETIWRMIRPDYQKPFWSNQSGN